MKNSNKINANAYNTSLIMRLYNEKKEANKNYRVHATNTNTKLGKFIFNINLPPVITCNPDAPCFKLCYGRKGRFRFPNVINSMENNLFAFCQDPKLFFEDIAYQTRLSKFVRWFGDGDMPNMEFLEGMCKVARKNPTTIYLAFTKQYRIVNDYIALGHRIPKNLSIVFSTWPNWIPENPYNFPTAWVRFDLEKVKKAERPFYEVANKAIPSKSFHCPNKCDTCLNCWKMKKGQSVEFGKH